MSFKNDGLRVLTIGRTSHHNDHPDKYYFKKLIICGLPRSGTTGVTSCLEKAGVSFGSNLSHVKEDIKFRASFF